MNMKSKVSQIKFWIDEKKKNRVWFGGDLKKHKYNWIDVGQEDIEGILNVSHKRDYYIVYIRGEKTTWLLRGNSPDDFYLTKLNL